MSKAIEPPPPVPAALRRRKPPTKAEQARMVLLGTTATVSAVLAAWLLTWVLFREPGAVAAGWSGPSGVAGPVLPFQREDALAFGRPLEIGAAPGAPVADLRTALKDAVNRRGDGPLVVYLSAPGLSHDGRPYFLPAVEADFVTGRAGEDALTSVEAIIDLLATDPGRPKLLILDASQVTTDRDLGVFGNGFVHRLSALLESKAVPNLAVLSACAPGQEGQLSEADRRSAFAHFVARGLAGAAAPWDPSGRVTVQGLARYVRTQVARWAAAHRQAVQTPVLLGDVSVNFPLRPTAEPRPAQPSEDELQELAALTDELAKAWQTRDRLAALAPYRHAPLLWRRYLDGLLRAEWLVRSARPAEAREALATAATLADRVETEAPGLRLDRAWSLALGESLAAALPADARTELDGAARSITRAIDQLTGGIAAEAPRGPQDAPESSEASGGVAGGTAPDETATDSDGSPPGSSPLPDARPQQDAEGSAESKKAATPNRRGRTNFDALVETVHGARVPRIIEAQLDVWAQTYLDGHLGPPFEGRRAEVLRRAQDVRRLAERAAAADERAAPRIEPVVALADARRRAAQDRLFAPEGIATEEAARLLEEAAALDGAALAYAAEEARARDLIDRILTELPYLGAWEARRSRGGPRSTFLALLDDTEALGRSLGEGVDFGAGAGPDGNPAPVIDALNTAQSNLAGRVGRVATAYDALAREFLTLCDLAGSTRGSTRPAELDDLLRVPLIPAGLRMTLLAKARAADPAATLAAAPEAAPDPSAPVTVDASEPDPHFWAHALGLARVECTLLALGGADPDEVEALRRDVEAARVATSQPPVAFEAMGRFNRRLRTLRASMAEVALEAIGGPERNWDDTRIAAELTVADRAARALPRAYTLAVPQGSAPEDQLARFLRQSTLRRLGRRLVADYAPEHARLLFDAAGEVLDTAGLAADVAQAEAVARSRLTIAPAPAGTVSIGNADGQIAVRVTAAGAVPEGRGLVTLGFDPDRPISVGAGDNGDGDELAPSGLVPLPGASGSATQDFVLRRTAYAPEAIRFDVSPTLFYRGRVVAAPAPVQVVLTPAEEEVEVVIRQHDRKITGDQFLDHPGRGYLHFNARLWYDLVLTNKTDRELTVWVSATFDGQPPDTATLTLAPGASDDSLQGTVVAVAAPEAPPGPDGKPAPPPEPGPFEVPLHRPRILSVEVKEGNASGRSLSIPRQFEFHQQPVTQYAAAYAQFDPTRGRLHVRVYHLASDRVRGPIKCTATIAGERIEIDEWVPKGGFAYFDSKVFFPPFPEKIAWSVDVGHKVNAFSGVAETNVPPPQTPPPQAPQAPPPSTGL